MFKSISQEPVIFLFKKMWQFAEGHRRYVVLFIALSVVANIVGLAEPFVFGEFLNELQNNGLSEHNISTLLWWLGALLFLEVAFWLFLMPSRILENIAAFRTHLQYQKHLISGVLDLGLAWHAERDSGDTIDKVNKASEGLKDFGGRVFLVVEVVMKVVGTTVVLLLFNVPIALLTLGLIVIALMVILQFDFRLVQQYKQLNLFDNRISARIFDALSNVVSVKVLHIEKPIGEGITEAMWKPFSLFRKNSALVEAKWFTGAVLFRVILIMPLAGYILYLYRNNIVVEIGTISALYLYLSRLVDVYFTFSFAYEDMFKYKAQVQNAESIEAAFRENNLLSRTTAPEWNTLTVANVLFRYEDDNGKDAHDLNDVSLTFKKGERIALIGESGSGKTTFLKVLHGMYPTAQGTVSFDGAAPHKTSFADLDLKSTLVPQEPEVFSASIEENITLGMDYTSEDIRHAIDVAEFSSVVERLPKGLASVINEKGVNLSGGQKQRLALARAVLFAGEKQVILLDESTSSVDSETETNIYQHLFKHFEGRTILASIHKLNLLKYFDRVIMFERGKLVDHGTFDELLERNAAFKANWERYVAAHKHDTKEL